MSNPEFVDSTVREIISKGEVNERLKMGHEVYARNWDILHTSPIKGMNEDDTFETISGSIYKIT